METATESTPHRDMALARAVIYRYLSDALRHPAQRALTGNEWSQALSEALECTGSVPLTSRALACLLQGGDAARVEADYGRIIGHTPRAGVPPYESEWLGAAGDLLQYHQMSDVSAYYTAFGLCLNERCDERVDHIAVELSFLHFLCAKEAYAHARGEDQLAQVAEDGQRNFITEHVARWAPAFFRRLGDCGRGGFYEALSDFADHWLAAECLLLGVERGDPTLAPGETSMSLEDTCMSCAHASSCVPGGSPPPPEFP